MSDEPQKGSLLNTATKNDNNNEQQPSSSSPSSSEQSASYTAWAKAFYQRQSQAWTPWLENQYLRWFTNDNKASYATKQNLDKSKVTGVGPVDQLQDGVHETVSGQFGQKGLFKPIGDAVSKEGIDRAERTG